MLKPNERIDDLQRNNYRIIQDPERFCFGMDAVLLSGFAKAKEGDHVIDLGTGTGIIPILMEAKTKASNLVGLEIQPESADMAQRSVELNHLEKKIRIVTGDIREASSIFGAATFDVVTSNPPYMTEHHGITNEKSPKAIARHELLCTLEDVSFYMVHRPFRLVDIMVLMREYHLEPKRMKLVYPYIDKAPNMVLIEGLRGGRPRMTVEKPLIVYKEPGVYTDEIYEIYGY